MNIDPNTVPSQQKKVWQKPELYLLDTDTINTKSHPNIHEKTGYQSGSTFFTKNGLLGYNGTSKQAIS